MTATTTEDDLLFLEDEETVIPCWVLRAGYDRFCVDKNASWLTRPANGASMLGMLSENLAGFNWDKMWEPTCNGCLARFRSYGTQLEVLPL